MAAPMHVGVVGGGPPAAVDEVGTLTPPLAGWTLEWWIGADDRWRVPAHEVAVRRQRVRDVPVVETAMRVPGGDAVARVYGAAAPGAPIVVEVENRSPAPFVVAFAVRGAARIAADGAHVVVDDAFGLTTTRAPSRWARTVAAPVLLPVTTGRAETGPFPPARDRSARLEAAFLHPVAHRTTLRAVLTHGRRPPPLDPRSLPPADDVVRGWSRLLDRGTQTRVPDDGLEHRILAARAELLLRAQLPAPGPAVTAALEDWGFDDEAAAAWRRLGTRDRRRAANRTRPASWAEVAPDGDDAAFLLAVRRLLVDDEPTADGTVDLCPHLPEAWHGRPVEVRDAPVVGGRVSFALRWHGARPALLWEAPPGRRVRAPALDPDWVAPEPAGEALLAPVRAGG